MVVEYSDFEDIIRQIKKMIDYANAIEEKYTKLKLEHEQLLQELSVLRRERISYGSIKRRL